MLGTETAAVMEARAMTECLRAVSRDRSKEEFVRLFEYYAPRVKAWLMRSGTSPSQAEEIAQETLLTVWRKAGMFDPARASASTWIYTIARNRRIDLFRRNNRPEFNPNDPALVPDPVTPADQTLSEGQTAASLKAAIASLPDEQKAVVQKSFYEDKSHSEIAKDLQLPLGTVKSRLRLAFRRLRQVLEPSLGEAL